MIRVEVFDNEHRPIGEGVVIEAGKPRVRLDDGRIVEGAFWWRVAPPREVKA